jgi:membrane-associated phospholipid phosphatase
MATKVLAKSIYVGFALTAFALLARRVSRGDTGALDAEITRALQKTDTPWFATLMHAVSWPGFPPQSRIIPWLLPGAMLSAGRPLQAAFQLMGWGTGAISGSVKSVVRRPRPDLEDIVVAPARIRGTSFPSGHVIIYTGVYGFLAYLAHCHVRIRVLRRLIVGGLTTMIALVGPSRVYLGHHWFSDVVASYLLGTSYVAILSTIYQRALRRQNGK